MLTIVIPVKNPPDIKGFLKGNKHLLKRNAVVVVDSGGGEALESIAKTYVRQNLTFWEARKLGYECVKSPYVLNLDADIIVPEGYVDGALALLRAEVDAVSIFYEDVGHCQGALEFGVSIWKTEVLRRLYDFSLDLVLDGKITKVGTQAFSTLNNGWCECTYLWRKLKQNGYRLETLPYRAKHLK